MDFVHVTSVKHSGSLMKMLPILLGMATLAVLSLMFFSYTEDMDKRETADQIARQYILKMETVGLLTNEDKYNMLEELKKTGFVDINLTGTTLKKAGYGKEITLVINANLPVIRYLTSSSQVQKNEQTESISITRKSTAKY